MCNYQGQRAGYLWAVILNIVASVIVELNRGRQSVKIKCVGLEKSLMCVYGSVCLCVLKEGRWKCKKKYYTLMWINSLKHYEAIGEDFLYIL